MRRATKSGNVKVVHSLILEAREPDKNIFTLAHRQRRESVLTIFGHEISQDRCVRICHCWLERLLEEFNEAGAHWSIEVIDRRYNQFLSNIIRSRPQPFLVFK